MNRIDRRPLDCLGGCLAGCLVVAAMLTTAAVPPALADRHCSYARESAFYARELSREALDAPVAECPAKMTEALDRIRQTMVELGICSCAPAEAPLEGWLAGMPPTGEEEGAACRESARRINAIARRVLIDVEKCF